MNETQMAILVRDVKALCPAQKFDEYTPDAWLEVIGDLDYDDAHAAIVALGRQQPFIGPSDIATEVRRVSNTRPSFPPGTGHLALEADIDAVDCSVDAAGYIRALRAKREKFAGPPVPFGAAIAIERTFVDVPSKRPRTTAIPGPRRPMLAIEAAPTTEPGNVELAIADAVLNELPDWWQWMEIARRALQDDGQPVTRRAVTIHAAELATQSPNGV